MGFDPTAQSTLDALIAARGNLNRAVDRLFQGTGAAAAATPTERPTVPMSATLPATPGVDAGLPPPPGGSDDDQGRDAPPKDASDKKND